MFLFLFLVLRSYSNSSRSSANLSVSSLKDTGEIAKSAFLSREVKSLNRSDINWDQVMNRSVKSQTKILFIFPHISQSIAGN